MEEVLFGVLTGEGGGGRGRERGGMVCTVGLLDELRSFDRLERERERERERKHGVFSCDLLYRLAIWGKGRKKGIRTVGSRAQ